MSRLVVGHQVGLAELPAALEAIASFAASSEGCEKASDVIEDLVMILNALLDIAPSVRGNQLLTLARARELASSARDQKEGLRIEAPADGTFRCPLPSVASAAWIEGNSENLHEFYCRV